ncbi:MAG: anhydro-N-acetylmuramic acid kinase [Pelagibacterales bacterium]|nr:anhydro-N-acetylmuramic acid kinase [Pelagibacterales bacterium]
MQKLITSIGLMSGTSSDGIDASVIKSDGEDIFDLIGNYFYPYDNETKLKIRKLKEKIDKASDLKKNQEEIKTLEKEITLLHFKVINLLLNKLKINKSEIDLVGLHGHTIFHSFHEKKTKQLGDGKFLSQLTGLNVIYDFRENDLNNGGQGAPLVPIFHKLLQKKLQLSPPVVFVNIGGISNLTYLNNNDEIISFDTGPGNYLIDKMLQLKSNDKIQYDKNGEIALKGKIDKNILNTYLEDPYYDLTPPKSLDVNDFNLSLVRGISLENSITTLSELTSLTIVNSFNFFLKKPKEIILCGGGRKNNYIYKRIKKISNILTHNIDAYEIDGDFVESQAFAYLAIRSYLKKSISFPKTTGVLKPTTGGKLIEFK